MDIFKLLGVIAVDNDDANSAIDETRQVAEKSESKMSAAFKKIGLAVASAFAVDKIINFGKEIVNAAATVSAEQSAFEQIMGEYSDTAQEKINEIADTTGMVATRLTPYMTSMTAKFKGLGYGIDDATDLAQTGLTIAADAAAFWDKSLEDSMGSLNSFVNGNYEGGEAIGLFANETTLASWASENLGLKWDDLTEKDKQFARLQFAKAMQEASGATGQAAKESDQYANVQANLSEKWRQFKAEIGEPVLQKIVIPAMEVLGKIIPKLSDGFKALTDLFRKFFNWCEKNEGVLKALATAAGVALAAFLGLKAGMAIQNLVQGWQKAQITIALFSATAGKAAIAQGALNGSLTLGETLVALFTGKVTLAQLATALWAKVQAGLNAVMSANPIALTVMAVAALTAGIIALVGWLNKKNTGFVEAAKATTEFETALANVEPKIADVNKLMSTQGNTVSDLETKIAESEQKITDTIRTALQEQGALRDEDIRKIEEYNAEILRLQQEQLSIYREQQNVELQQIIAEGTAITQEGAAQHIANSKAVLDQSNAQVEEAYNTEVALLYNKHQAAGTLNSTEYQRELDNLKANRDAQIVLNEEFYKGGLTMLTENSMSWISEEKGKWQKVNDEIGQGMFVWKENMNGINMENSKAWLQMALTAKSNGAELSAEAQETVGLMIGAFEDLPPASKKQGKETLLAMISGMEDQIPGLENASEMSVDEIVETLKTAVEPSKTTGKNVAKGVASGIESEEGSIGSRISGFANRLISRMNNAFKVKSPSRLTMETGKFLSQGLGIGIEENAEDALDPLQNLVDKTKGISNELSTFGMSTGDYNVPDLTKKISSSFKVSTANRTDAMLQSILTMLSQYLPNMDKEIVLDDGTLVGKLSPKIDKSMGDINKLRVRGM